MNQPENSFFKKAIDFFHWFSRPSKKVSATTYKVKPKLFHIYLNEL